MYVPAANESQDCSVPAALRRLPAVCLRSTSVGARRVPLTHSPPRSYCLVSKYPRIQTSALACLCVRLPSFIVKKSSRDRLLRKIRYENKQIHITIQQSYDCLYHPSSIHRRIRSAHIQAGLLTSDHHFLCPFSTFTARSGILPDYKPKVNGFCMKTPCTQ